MMVAFPQRGLLQERERERGVPTSKGRVVYASITRGREGVLPSLNEDGSLTRWEEGVLSLSSFLTKYTAFEVAAHHQSSECVNLSTFIA